LPFCSNQADSPDRITFERDLTHIFRELNPFIFPELSVVQQNDYAFVINCFLNTGCVNGSGNRKQKAESRKLLYPEKPDYRKAREKKPENQLLFRPANIICTSRIYEVITGNNPMNFTVLRIIPKTAFCQHGGCIF